MTCYPLPLIARLFAEKTDLDQAVGCVDNSKSRVAHATHSPTAATAMLARRPRHKIGERRWTSRCDYLLREQVPLGVIIF